MSRTFHHGERRIRVKGVRRQPPDLKKLARALVDLAQAQAEAEAQSQADDQNQASPVRTKRPGSPSASPDTARSSKPDEDTSG